MIQNKKSCLTCEKQPYCFKGLSEKELELIDKNRIENEYTKDKVILKQGSFASDIAFLHEGKIKTYFEENEKKLIIKIFSENEVIGISALFGNKFFQFSASTVEKSSVCLVNTEIVKKILMSNNEFSAEITRRVSNLNNYLINRMFIISNKKMHGRVADIILYLSREVYKSDNFTITISRKDIADFTSLAMENVIRILREFHNDKIINISNKDISIISAPLLEKLKEIG